MYRSFLFLLALAPLGFGQINAPRVGLVRYDDSTVRPVFGLPASFIVGQPIATGVNRASFSDSAGILTAADRVLIVNASGTTEAEEAGSTDAIVGIGNSLTTAVAFVPGSNTVFHFDGKEFQTTQIGSPLPGRVLDLRAGAETASLLVERDGAVSEITVAFASGSILSENFLPGIQAPAAYLGNSIVYVDPGGLEIESRSTPVKTLPFVCSSNVGFEHMANDWLHISCAGAGQQWALHVSPKGVHLSELPLPLKGARQ
jgi:hypothetical protein